MTAPARQETRSPIGKTLVVNLAAIGLVAILTLLVVLTSIIDRTFADLEESDIAAHQARLETFKADRLNDLEARTKDWAIWDDTFAYSQDFNAAYQSANLNHKSFANLLIDALLVVRYSDGAYRSSAFSRETGAPLPQLAAELATKVVTPEFKGRLLNKTSIKSFVNLGGQLYALSAVEIRRGDGSGDPPGYMVLLTALNSKDAGALLQADVKIVPGAAPQGTAVRTFAKSVVVTSPFLDSSGKMVGYLETKIPRPLEATANQLVFLTLLGTLVVVLALLVGLQLRVRQLVLNPIERLHAHLQSVRTSGELKVLDAATRDDELGAMQKEFNSMASELQDLRTELEAKSFAIGKSQSAIDLMHNLRNTLAPLRVILETLERQVGTSLPPQTSRALSELQSHELDHERREKLVQFLSLSHEDLSARNADNQHLVREAARHLYNGFSAIDAAQNRDQKTRFDERCELPRILGHSGNIARYAEDLAIQIEVIADQSAVVPGNRVLINQVFDNLVMNAVEAIKKSGQVKGAITLRAEVDPAINQCRVTVADNGIGFDPVDAQRLFERGYSTREERTGGLGLHWCSNTVRAMGGELTIESQGPGSGAVATVTFRLWQDAAAAEPMAA